MPALIKWTSGGLRERILALADAYVETFDLFGLPSDLESEKDLDAQAKAMEGGATSGIRRELDLIQVRTRSQQSYSGIEQEINRAMILALDEGKLKLKQQRIKAKNSAARPQPTHAAHSAPPDLMPRIGEHFSSPHRPAEASTSHLPELPQKYQESFDGQWAKADLEHASADTFPNHPQFAAFRLHESIRIQKVYFAYCTAARQACRDRAWTVGQVNQATVAAWVFICDTYFVREHATASEAQKLHYRENLWRTVVDEQRWKGHLSELVELAEDVSGTGRIPPGTLGHAVESVHARGIVSAGETRSGRSGNDAPAPAVIRANATKRGPKTDYQTAARVSEIVASVARDRDWRSTLDAICEALDDQKIARPKTWKKRGHNDWYDCLASERHLVDKAISHHLKLVAKQKKTIS